MNHQPRYPLEVSPQELQELWVNNPTLIVLDVREKAELLLSSIQGTSHIPMNELPLKGPLLNPKSHIITLCHHGYRSLHAALYFRELGFTKVQSLKGGIDAWSRLIDSSVPLY